MTFSRRDFVAALAATGFTAAALPIRAQNQDSGSSITHPVYVVATVSAKEGKRDEMVRIFKRNVPAVHAEEGCIYYEPAIDVDAGLDAQDALRPNVMVVVEKWESLEHLHVHLVAPHMATYREAVKDIVEGVTLQILKPA